jgi:hypothetical protein
MIAELTAENLMDEYQNSISMSDALHSYLHQEYENGRILRLLIKLGLVNERPDGQLSGPGKNSSSSWSENGDRYILKLFRDYVFHQNDASDPNGSVKPVLEVGHIISSLNKLDAGSTEQMILCSRDNKDLIIVSFADVKRCLEKAIADLAEQAGVNAYDKQSSSQAAAAMSYQGYQPAQYSSSTNSSIQEPYLSRTASAPSYTNRSISQPMVSRGSSYPSPTTPAMSYTSASESFSASAASYVPSASAQRNNASYEAMDSYDGLKPTAQEWTPGQLSSASSMSAAATNPASVYRTPQGQQPRGMPAPSQAATSSADYYNYYGNQMQPTQQQQSSRAQAQASTARGGRTQAYSQAPRGAGAGGYY